MCLIRRWRMRSAVFGIRQECSLAAESVRKTIQSLNWISYSQQRNTSCWRRRRIRHALDRFQKPSDSVCLHADDRNWRSSFCPYIYWERACGRRGELPGSSYGALQNWILILLIPQLHYCMTWLPTACSKSSITYSISVQVLTESSFPYRNPFKIIDLVDDTCGKSRDATLYRLPILQKVLAFVLMLSSSQTQRP